MLEKNDRIRRHDNEFDKIEEDARADEFKTNAGLRAATAEPPSIV
jgi:hypothetical protein